MWSLFLTVAGFACVEGAFVITDPSNTINPADWIADNSVLAVYNITPVLYQTNPIVGAHEYSSKSVNLTHQYLTVNANDTSVLVLANSSEASVDYTNIVKFGSGSNLYQESFYGLNAAVNVANDTIASFSDVNITVHNGAAGIFVYGNSTVVTVNNAWLYSSGPTSHGLYAAGNGTIHAKNIAHFSGGNRCSSFSGDNPAGYVHVENAVAHTAGIGSAICYALGVCNMTNVIGHADQAPVTFSDGPQTTIWTDSDLTAGLLGGVVVFSSMVRQAGASITFDHSKLRVLGSNMPGLWAGNIIATANIISSQINVTTSGILAVANYSQVTQAFDYYADYSDNNDLSPAELTINVEESDLSGSLVAYNASSISLVLNKYSSWTGDAYSGFGQAYFGLDLDSTSNWTLTANTKLLNFTDSDSTLSNVISNGYNITYNSTAAANSGWGGKTIKLRGGGYFTPAIN